MREDQTTSSRVRGGRVGERARGSCGEEREGVGWGRGRGGRVG